MKTGIVAYAKGNPPTMVVEFSRRVLYNDVRPSFDDLEEAIKSVKSGTNG
jgi:chemotaxis protein MotA